MRFLHLADVHLDTPFAGRSPELRKRLRQASRDAFGRAVDVAVSEQVHAVLIAGDLFDGARLSFETEAFLLEQLRRLDAVGIPVVYASGNHDPGRAGARTGDLPWPDSLTLVPDAAPRRVAVRSDDRVVGYVTAAGHAGPSETRDLAAGFPRPSGALPEVAVLHTQVVGSRRAEEHHPYAPATLATLRAAGYHYWALGHVHTRQTLSESPAVHYPGNLQGRTYAEAGPRGGLLVEMGDGPPRVTFRAFAPVRWETLVVDTLESAGTLDRVVAAVHARWHEDRVRDPDPDAEWMVRVVLTGGVPLWRELARDENRLTLTRELIERLGVLDVELRAERVHAPVQVSEHHEREDVLGVALRAVEALARGEGTPPEGLDGELGGWEPGDATSLSDYVRSLLDDGEGELLARMLRPTTGGD
jgi:hypothetical protein